MNPNIDVDIGATSMVSQQLLCYTILIVIIQSQINLIASLSSQTINNLWTIDDQQQCDSGIQVAHKTNRPFNCFLLFQSIFLLWSKIELISLNPTLFIIHQLSRSVELIAIRNIAQQQ